jgi:hypothetical protein
MADWLKTNRACTTLWTTLSTMQQIFTNFEESGALAMTNLTFFNPLVSADLRRQQALMVADELDQTFRIGRGAKFEKDYDRGRAIDEMVSILIDGSKTVTELAVAADKAYQFWAETH